MFELIELQHVMLLSIARADGQSDHIGNADIRHTAHLRFPQMIYALHISTFYLLTYILCRAASCG